MASHATGKTSVLSRDGTQIVYWASGDGPPLVLVHGAPADHTRWQPLLPYLMGVHRSAVGCGSLVSEPSSGEHCVGQAFEV